MNRKQQMTWLATLTAITLVGQYVMTGAAGLGQRSSALPSWFWGAEMGLWGLRAIVEIGVVVYIGMTAGQTVAQNRILWGFKIGLIVLIVLTVGPVWASHSLGETMVMIFGRWATIGWGFLLAGVSATMLAGVSYAYVVQPFDCQLIVLQPEDHQKLLSDKQAAIDRVGQVLVQLDEANERGHSLLVQVEADKQTAIAQVHADNRRAIIEMKEIIERSIADKQAATIERDTLRAELSGIQQGMEILQLLPASAVARLIAQFAGAERPQAKLLAERLGLAESTIRGVYRVIDAEG